MPSSSFAKPLPPGLNIDQLRAIVAKHGTPVWVYDASAIRQRVADLQAFDVIRFAQKANSNIHILSLLRSLGVAADAVSLGEIERARAASFSMQGSKAAAAPEAFTPSNLVFTADVFDHATLAKIVAERIPVNAGSTDMLRQLAQHSPGHPVWLRINPGFGHGHSSKTNTGGEHSKHGIWHTELPTALEIIRATGLQLIGLHMHIGSGVDYGHLSKVCDAMVTLAAQVDMPLHAISAGGGLSTPYKEGDPRIDTAHYFSLWDKARRAIEQTRGHKIHLEIEPGRYLTAESGLLIAEVRATKYMGWNYFALVDAGFSDLMRPSMYGSYHAISVLPGATQTPKAVAAAPRRIVPTVVAGPLCESGDVFTQGEGGVVQPRDLPQTQVGDLLVFHDAGAYGASMSSNYNSRCHAPEVLVDHDQVRLIRRRQTTADLLGLELLG
jgi:diaminopimelate decarboxylase